MAVPSRAACASRAAPRGPPFCLIHASTPEQAHSAWRMNAASSPVRNTSSQDWRGVIVPLHDNLVDFAVVLMTGSAGTERMVARADISHTGLHVHWFRQDGTQLRRQEISLVRTQPEVQAAYNEAFDRVTGKRAEYKRRWRNG